MMIVLTKCEIELVHGGVLAPNREVRIGGCLGYFFAGCFVCVLYGGITLLIGRFLSTVYNGLTIHLCNDTECWCLDADNRDHKCAEILRNCHCEGWYDTNQY